MIIKIPKMFLSTLVIIMLFSTMAIGCNFVSSNDDLKEKDKSPIELTENPFDPRKASVGDTLLGLTIEDISDLKEWDFKGPDGDAYYSAKVQFKGEITLSGQYICLPIRDFSQPDNPVQNSSQPTFFVSAESLKDIPKLDGDTRPVHFMITNATDALKLLGAKGSKVQATIVVDDYLINRHPSSAGIDQAKLVRVIEHHEIEESPGGPKENALTLFSKSSGNIHDYMPNLLAGNPVGDYHILPCFENFTRSTWPEMERVYGGPDWFNVLWNTLRDASINDHTRENEDQLLRDYYVGKAFLTSDGAYSEGLADILKLQWIHNPYIYSICLKERFTDEDAATLSLRIAYSLNYCGSNIFATFVPSSNQNILLALYPIDFPFGHNLIENSRETFRAESFGQVTVVECDDFQITYLHPSEGIYTVITVRTNQEGSAANGIAIGEPEKTLLDSWPRELKKLENIHYDDEVWFGNNYDNAYVYTEGVQSIIYIIKDGLVSGIGLMNGLDGPTYFMD